MGPFAVILPAAGRSSRFGDPTRKKTFIDLDGTPVWLRAATPFLAREDVFQVVVAVSPDDREAFERRFSGEIAARGLTIVEGGAERFDTIARALDAVDPSCAFVAVHDAARPCAPPDVIESAFAAARLHGAAVPGLPVSDSLKLVADGAIVRTVPRAGLFAVQTPQCFRRDLLESAYALRDRVPGVTDDAQLVEALGHPCVVVPGSPFNLKITGPADLDIARAFLRLISGQG